MAMAVTVTGMAAGGMEGMAVTATAAMASDTALALASAGDGRGDTTALTHTATPTIIPTHMDIPPTHIRIATVTIPITTTTRPLILLPRKRIGPMRVLNQVRLQERPRLPGRVRLLPTRTPIPAMASGIASANGPVLKQILRS